MILTAKEFWNNACKNEAIKSPSEIMIEFTKLHCIEQVKTILNETEICLYQNKEDLEIITNKVDYLLNETNFKDLILNSYDLNNIK